MAVITPNRLIAFFVDFTVPGKSKAAHDVAVKAYKKTNGPTDNLRRVYSAYQANKAKSNKRNEDARAGR